MSKLQVDDIVNKDDTGSVGFSKGAVVTGIVTATGGSFSGNVSVGGVLTYEDVTSIDSVGIITARSDISIADKIIHTGDTNTAIRFPAADTFTVETAGSERVRIDSSGNFGIGTASPSAKLQVNSGDIYIAARASSTETGIFFRNPTDTATYAKIGYTNTTGNLVLGTTNTYSTVFVSNNTERMRIDSSGRLLVGTTSGTHKLVVNQNNSGGIAAIHLPQDESTILGYHSTTYLKFGGNMTVGGGSSVIFENAGTEAARITSGRSLCINSTGSDNSTGGPLCITGRSAQGMSTWNIGSNGYAALYFNNASGSKVGDIIVNSSSTAYNTSSDYRLKENVVGITDGITRVKQLSPSRFNFIADPDITVDGFIAHEAQAVVPEAATGTKDEVDADGNPVYQGIDQSKFVPLLTAALQEAISEIETLKQRLTDAGL